MGMRAGKPGKGEGGSVKKAEVYFPIKSVTKGPKHHFVGFNDICPWNSTGRYILAMETDFTDRMPQAGDRAIVGVVDLENGGRFRPVGETLAWNFQQGARAQWVPGADACLIYNDREGDRFVSVIVDVETGESRKLPLPIYALSPDGSFALTINFARLHRLYPGYGYAGVPDATEDDKAPQDDGIYMIDLMTGKHELLISIAQIVQFGNIINWAMDGDHWLTHILFNPDGSRFAFLHRWRLKDGGIYTRLISASPEGTDLRCIAEGVVSHFTWRNSHQILAWARQFSIASKARQSPLSALPLFQWAIYALRGTKRKWFRQYIIGDRYLILNDGGGEVQPVGVGVLTEDGHMSYSPNGQWILTDTYPDDQCVQSLILYRCKDGRRIEVGRFSEPEQMCGTGYRCDLHPRWSKKGNKICIDSAHDGTRQIYIVDVANIVQKS